MSNSTKEFKFKAEMKQLLNIIIHSLYTNPEVFLRELISNSSDALNKLRFLKLTNENIIQPEKELFIKIELDKENGIFSISDSGIGMTEKELINQLGTVAKSGTLEFLKNLKKSNTEINGNLIGQFGVGFYSVFMVTDEVTVETRSALPDNPSLRWVSQGEDKFSIEHIDEIDRGTKISFKLKDEYKDFAQDHYVKSILNKYSNFIDYEIYVNNEKVNNVKPIWEKRKEDISEDELKEFYKFISNDYEPYLDYLQLNIEGNVNFKAIVFIPSVANPMFMREFTDKTLSLYTNKVFISDEIKEILPDYLRFVKGVIDTEDLPLNVSREVVQSSPVTAKISRVLSGKILQMLEDWAANDKPKYETFFKQFGSLFKLGITTDFSNRERLIELYRFNTSACKTDELTSFKEYVARMKPEQKEIFYLSGSSIESIKHNPNLEYFKKMDYEVIFLPDPTDLFVFPYIFEYDKKPIIAIDKYKIEESQKPDSEKPEADEKSNSLIEAFKRVLKDEVEDVRISHRLVDSPVTLVAGDNALDAQTEKMMQLLDKNFKAQKKILEINLEHPLIKNLSKLNSETNSNPLLEKSILQLFDGAGLIYGEIKSPVDFNQRMIDFMIKATT